MPLQPCYSSHSDHYSDHPSQAPLSISHLLIPPLQQLRYSYLCIQFRVGRSLVQNIRIDTSCDVRCLDSSSRAVCLRYNIIIISHLTALTLEKFRHSGLDKHRFLVQWWCFLVA
jgi:hypothetical protein